MAVSDDIEIGVGLHDLSADDRRLIEENFERIKSIIAVLDAGQTITDTFTTVDGKTVTVSDGIIMGIV